MAAELRSSGFTTGCGGSGRAGNGHGEPRFGAFTLRGVDSQDRNERYARGRSCRLDGCSLGLLLEISTAGGHHLLTGLEIPFCFFY